MKKTLISITLFLNTLTMNAQKDTIYFDARWEEVSKENASFFRQVPLEKAGDLFVIKDYYINGQLQMEGFSTSPKEDIFQGNTIWYNENGQKTEEIEYDQGIKNGKLTTYFVDGAIQKTCIYKEGKPYTGTAIPRQYRREQFTTFEEGIITGSVAYYTNSQQIAFKTTVKEEYKKVKTIFYNRDGSEIGQLFYNLNTDNNEAYNGPEVEFHQDGYEIDRIKNINHRVDGKLEGLEKSFDAQGNIIAQGTYKNSHAQEGTFYSFYDKSMSIYRAGDLAEIIDYKDENREKIKYHGKFENGKINGLVLSGHYDKDESYECIFKDGEPFDGQFFEFYALSTYENGEKKSYIEYKEKTGEIDLIEKYEHGKRSTQKMIDGQLQAEFIYKDGKPYEGLLIYYDDSTTYVAGKKHGPFSESVSFTKFRRSGNYVEDKVEGKVTYAQVETGDRLSCVFKNDLPMDGTVVSENLITEYKNGEKHGQEIENFRRGPDDDMENSSLKEFNKIIRTYQQDVTEEISYFLDDKKIGTCLLKNSEPFDGIFYDEKYKIILDNDKLIQKTYNVLYLVVRDRFENDVLVERIARIEGFDEPIEFSNGTYRNGLPFEGTILTYDEGMTMEDFYMHAGAGGLDYDKTFTISTYKNGKKDGLEKIYEPIKIEDNSPTQLVYKEGVLMSKKVSGLNFRKQSKAEGIYKNGKPHTGEFIFKGELFTALETYEDGFLQSEQYYFTHREGVENLGNLTFLEGKPFEGDRLEAFGMDLHQHVYEQGKLIKTLIYSSFIENPNLFIAPHLEATEIVIGSFIQKSPSVEIVHQSNGFETKKIEDIPYPIIKVKYTNEDQTAGKASIQEEENIITSFSFSDGTISNFQSNLSEHSKSEERYFDSQNRFNYKYHTSEIIQQMTTEEAFSKKPDYKDFYYLRKMMRGNVISRYFKVGEDQFFATNYRKDGKVEGVIIFPGEQGLHGLTIFKNGENIFEMDDLSLDKIDGVLKKYNNLK